MDDMERLLELLEKAWEAIDKELPCEITTRAYLSLADEELVNLIHASGDQDLRDLRAAYAWIGRNCDDTSSLKSKTHRWRRFWQGFIDGRLENTLPGRVGAYYKQGYNFGLYGSME